MVLIGWWHSKPRHLRRYIKLYVEQFHVNTLSHIPAYYHVFLPWTIPNDIKRLANELIVTWKEHGKPDNVGFHVFSDYGTYHYAMLCDEIRKIANNKDYADGSDGGGDGGNYNDDYKTPPSFFKKMKYFLTSKPSTKIESESSFNNNGSTFTSSNITNDEAEMFIKSIKTCVIDSAPSPVSEEHVALALAGSFSHKISSSSLETQVIKPPSFLLPILSFFFSFPIVKYYQDFAHKALENIPGGTLDGNRINYLFLYGPGDQIVPESDVVKFMNKLKKDRGEGKGGELIKVTGKRFGPNSEHVQHFLKYPGEYIDALKVFYGLN